MKLRMHDAARARKMLAKIGAKPVRHAASGKDGRCHELNTLFDTPQGGFARHGQLLRLRVETPAARNSKAPSRAILTYKGPAEGPAKSRFKEREEHEVIVADAGAMHRILEALGLRGWFRYEKFRTVYSLPSSSKWAAGLHLDLDETPVGIFLELEGPHAAIDRAAKELGFAPADYITKDYLFLHIERIRKGGTVVSQLAPGVVTGIPDMMFP
ncbi:MAG: class IV adenylate cyclase [Candidatus Acidiferrales bacterium]